MSGLSDVSLVKSSRYSFFISCCCYCFVVGGVVLISNSPLLVFVFLSIRVDLGWFGGPLVTSL